MRIRSAAVVIAIAFPGSLALNAFVIVGASDPFRRVLMAPGQAVYSAMPHETAAFVFGYEGQGPHHYLGAISSTVVWWLAFALLATIVYRAIQARRKSADVA